VGSPAVDTVAGAIRWCARHEALVDFGEGDGGMIRVTLRVPVISPDAGEIRFAGRDVTRAPQHRRVRAGLARSFQITRLFKGFSALDNVALAVQARSGSSLSLRRPVLRETALFDEARALPEEVGL
jgi:ABC-type branched-subunit amino acid transport system ATPase component